MKELNSCYRTRPSSLNSDDYVIATYIFSSRLSPLKAATALCKEQSVGHKIIGNYSRSKVLVRKFGAKIIHISKIADPERRRLRQKAFFKAQIAFPIANFGADISQLLLSVVGEIHHIAVFDTIRLTAIEMPPSYLKEFPGPRYGVKGLRKILDVLNRPLFCAPVKPSVGLSPKHFAELAYSALLGGADIVKDDELLSNPSYSLLRERIKQTLPYVRKAEDKTGERKLYIANISLDIPSLYDAYELAKTKGVDGIMIAPMLCGFSTLRHLRTKTDMLVFSHNALITAFSGNPSFGMGFDVAVNLQRICGADVIVLPSPWGTFLMSEKEHRYNLQACSGDLANIKTTMPALAGGNWAGNLRKCHKSVGSDNYMVISGTGIFDHPNGAESGAKSLRQAWLAIDAGESLSMRAKSEPDLRAALDYFSPKLV